MAGRAIEPEAALLFQGNLSFHNVWLAAYLDKWLGAGLESNCELNFRILI